MNITMLTPDREVFKGKISSVKVPGSSGRFQVLKNHAPIVSSLEEGEVHLVPDGSHEFFDYADKTMKTGEKSGKIYRYKISGGFIEVLHNEISLLVRGVEPLD
jgi:F-type H+-transporting ATPase subunit epsilon